MGDPWVGKGFLSGQVRKNKSSSMSAYPKSNSSYPMSTYPTTDYPNKSLSDHHGTLPDVDQETADSAKRQKRKELETKFFQEEEEGV